MTSIVPVTVPVILCGGAGTRLWPLSRRQSPKQFLPLLEGRSLFDEAVFRGLSIFDELPIKERTLLCVTAEDHKFLVKYALGALGASADILVEPVGRNTTAALCLAAMWVAQRHENATMVILPSDQMIDIGSDWQNAISLGLKAAQNGKWVSLGIKPNNPSSEFGYLQPGCEDEQVAGVFSVDSFLEKPEKLQAEQLCDDGWLWNAGVGVVQVETILAMIEKHAPTVFLACLVAKDSFEEEYGFVCPDRDKYLRAPALQIDKAVLEKSDNISVVPFYGYWRDIGSWQALEELAEAVGKGNRISGNATIQDCKDVYIRSPHRLIVAQGLEDITIVDTPDALLVARKNTLGDLGRVVDQLVQADLPQAEVHLRVAHPWGHYDVKASEPGYKVKCVSVRPGAAISSQFHYHRAEHWIVAKGTATISCDGKEREIKINESVFIPQGSIHRLENRTEEPLELVEVQTGEYLGEDDIVRVDDVYGRA